MNEANVEQPPEGFVVIPGVQGFSDCLQPLYRRVKGESVSLGLVVDRQHSNSMGICHGGALSTLADVAAATGVIIASEQRGGAPTINLSMDFISSARMGQWIQADVQLVTLKRKFGFSNGVIISSDGVVARFNATFYLPEHKGMVKPEATGDGAPAWFKSSVSPTPGLCR
jgi:uncharacterized protein (TIGR00369 family)